MEGAGPEPVEVTAETSGERLDKWLASHLPQFSRTYLQGLIEEGRVSRDGEAATAKEKVRAGCTYRVEPPAPVEARPEAEDVALDVLYEDSDLVVVNKPAGMTTHPAGRNVSGTLVNALLAHCGRSLSGIGGVRKPGIVHRLDRDTSGVLLVAKNDLAHRALSAQLKERTVTREYVALAQGEAKDEDGTIETLLGRSSTDRLKRAVVKPSAPDARRAVTHWRVAERFHGATLVLCRLETGRTHQIRVHLRHIGHPVVGDKLYGYQPEVILGRVAGRSQQAIRTALRGLKRQFLHAEKIRFVHPRTSEELSFVAALPDDLQSVLAAFRQHAG